MERQTIPIVLAVCLCFALPAAAAEESYPTPYRLFVEKPFAEVLKGLDEKFDLLPLSELNEYLDRQEQERREWNYVIPEVLHPLQSGAMELGGNFFTLLTENVDFFKKARELFEAYGYPRIDAFDKQNQEPIVALLSQPTHPFAGMRLGISVDLDDAVFIDEIITPTPHFKIDLGLFKTHVRFNPLRNFLRTTIENKDSKIFGLTFSGNYEYHLKNGGQRAEFSALKKVSERHDVWYKIRFRFEKPEQENDLMWFRKSGWEIAAFLFFKF